MTMPKLVATARKALTVRRVFGDPYEVDGVTVIPAAVLRGGVGGGGGRDGRGQRGEGGGFGLVARPVGAYVIKDGRVRWRPAVDVNRTIGLVATVVTVWLLTAGRRPTVGAGDDGAGDVARLPARMAWGRGLPRRNRKQ